MVLPHHTGQVRRPSRLFLSEVCEVTQPWTLFVYSGLIFIWWEEHRMSGTSLNGQGTHLEAHSRANIKLAKQALKIANSCQRFPETMAWTLLSQIIQPLFVFCLISVTRKTINCTMGFHLCVCVFIRQRDDGVLSIVFLPFVTHCLIEILFHCHNTGE